MRDLKHRSAEGACGGSAILRPMPLCAAGSGTGILGPRIPLDSRRAGGRRHGAGTFRHVRGDKGKANASLEGATGGTRSGSQGVRESAPQARGPQRSEHRGGGRPHGLQQNVLGALPQRPPAGPEGRDRRTGGRHGHEPDAPHDDVGTGGTRVEPRGDAPRHDDGSDTHRGGAGGAGRDGGDAGGGRARGTRRARTACRPGWPWRARWRRRACGAWGPGAIRQAGRPGCPCGTGRIRGTRRVLGGQGARWPRMGRWLRQACGF